jgi:hypothetical protein
MAEPFRIRFRNFTGLDFSTAERCRMPAAKPNMMGEETLLRGGIAALSAAGNAKGRLLEHTLDRCEGGATMTVSGAIPSALIPSSPEYTIAEGVSAGAGAGAGFSGGGGVYFWKKVPGFEFGLYGSLSAGLISNIGASAAFQVAYFFGPAPATLGGDSITLAVSVDVGVSIGGVLFISAPPSGLTPPGTTSLSSYLSTIAASSASWRPQVLGVGYTVGVGVSVLPVDISVMPGRTWTRSAMSR